MSPLKLGLVTALGAGFFVLAADGMLYGGVGAGFVRLGDVGAQVLRATRHAETAPRNTPVVERAPPTEPPLWLPADPAAFVVGVHDALAKASYGAEPPRRDAELDRVLDRAIDYAQLTRRALGEPCPSSEPGCANLWATLGDAQRREMQELITSFVRTRGRQRLAKASDYELRVRGVSGALGEERVRASVTALKSLSEPDTRVDLVLDRAADGLHATDLVVEGSSLARNLYDQFSRHLGDPDLGYAELVTKLRAKIAKLAPPAP